MHCFELRERLRRGIIALYPFVFLGHPGAARPVEDLVRHLQEDHGNEEEPTECATCAVFRWDGWDRHPAPGDKTSMILALNEEMRDWMRAELIDIDRGQPFRLTHANLLLDEHGGTTIGRATMNDTRAMLLVSNGGRASCRNHLAWVAVDAGDQIVVIEPGGVVRVVRTGPLEGGLAEYIFGWDGTWMHAFHQTRPSAQRVAASIRWAAEKPVVHKLIEQAPPQPKVIITSDDAASLGLPPGARLVNVSGVDCVIWTRANGEIVGADWLSKKRKKAARLRVAGASSIDEAVDMLRKEIELTSATT